MSDEPLERLIRVGLTQYEARVYTALVRRDGANPSEIARLAGVPRPRIYDVLESLVTKGVATLRPGNAAKYVAVEPQQAMQTMVAQHRQHLAGVEADADALAIELGAAYAEGTALSDPLDYIEVIRDPVALARRFDEIQGSVTDEMLAFNKNPYVERVDHDVVGMEMVRRDAVRSVYELEFLADPVQLDGVRQFVAAGEKARFVPELPSRLAVFDGRIAMIAMPDPVAGKDDVTTVVIEHPHLARLLIIAFEAVWDGALPFEQACAEVGITP